MESRQGGFFCWFCLFFRKTVSCVFPTCCMFAVHKFHTTERNEIGFFCIYIFKDTLLVNKAVEKGYCYLTEWL